MDYGEIFVGTFQTIWRHKRLWLYGMLGRLLATLGGVAGMLITLRLLPVWTSFIDRLSTGAIPTPDEIPADLVQQLGALWAGLACVAILGAIANYVINLVMRGATIGEASIAWSGEATDTGRGLRTGTARALHLFVLDLLWWVPIGLIALVVYVGGILALVAAAAGTSAGNNQGGANSSFLLICCCLPCCLFLVGLAIAVIFGTFSPLMYQAAVQNGRPGGQRTLGQAVSEGWRLAAAHWGAMLVFWLLLAVLWIVAWAVLAAISYPFSAATWGGLGAWFTTLVESGQTGVPATPSLPSINGGLLAASSLVEAIFGLLVYGFMQSFGLTMYAEVYRRFTQAEPAPLPGAPGGYPAQVAVAENAPRPGQFGSGHAGGETGARIYDAPGDLGLSVPEEPPEGDESQPAL